MEKKLIRTFGRVKSRKLSDHKNFLLKDFLPLYEIKKSDFENQNFSTKKICLEIGFGFGDFIFEKAKNNPDALFIGGEPHLNGIVNLLGKLEKDPLQNIKITTSDIRILLENFPKKIFSEIYILFPDPWPKTKHVKRRLITTEFLDEVLSPLAKDNAKLVIASDHDKYKTWILSSLLQSKNFFWTANSKSDWQNFPSDWTKTKYQKKAEIEGRIPNYFEAFLAG